MATLMQAHHEWATRPADQRFVSLVDLAEHVASQRRRSSAQVLSNKNLLAVPVEGDTRALAIIDRRSEAVAALSHFSFGQLCGRVGAPASYLRTLPTPLTADLVNWGIEQADVQETGVLVRRSVDGERVTMAAVTGPQYGRVWNTEIAGALVDRFGDGRSGDFRIPGEFGHEVEITRENTTLFAGDRDMFVFLADERNKVEIPNRRNGAPGLLSRGFFVWNSEVGSSTLGIATFLFDYACSNRIVWGAEGFKEIRIRHTSGAPDRWLSQVMPALTRYAQSPTDSIVSAVEHAQAAKIGDAERVTEFLAKRFTQSQVKAIKLVHEAEEQRPIETLWDAVTGATAYARSLEHQDSRIDIERKAGLIMSLAKA